MKKYRKKHTYTRKISDQLYNSKRPYRDRKKEMKEYH